MKEKTMNCPYCDKILEINNRQSIEKIKDKEVKFEELYYTCCDEEFETEEILKLNYINATDKYKDMKNLLTSKEIKKIREKYTISQSDLALLLGMGEITVTRYETGIIQEKSHDILLRIVNHEPHYLVKLLSESKLSPKKKNKIKEAIINNVDDKNKMIDNILAYDYFLVDNNLQGNTEFNKEKIFNCLKILLDNKIPLTKTKTAKLLFYIDFLMYKKYDRSVTGIAYFHMPFGALPLSYDQIYKYNNLRISIEQEGDKEKQIITNVESIDCLSNDEIEIVLLVANKFKDMNTKQIVHYMHNEEAYKSTNSNDLINYSYSKQLKEF